MKLIKQTRNSCLLVSAAMLLDTTPEQLIKETGHDGQEHLYGALPMPHCLRGHHMQEIIDCCMRRGLGLTPIEFYPRGCPENRPDSYHLIYTELKAQQRFLAAVKGRKGLLVGQVENGAGHAFAWDGRKVYDPNGILREIDDVYIKEAWILTKMF